MYVAITAKRISCFHDSLSKAKRMNASSERALATALVRALSHSFHKALWAKKERLRAQHGNVQIAGRV